MNKLPPIEKIYEAYSAIADGRVTFQDSDAAAVLSSDGTKQYTVAWRDSLYTSNDSATYWAGYPGYPVLAVWMLQGILPLNREIAAGFADINWNEANRKYKRNYAKAADAVMEEKGLDKAAARKEAERVYEALKQFEYTVGRGKGKP